MIYDLSREFDRFKMWAASEGILMPEPEDEGRLKDIAAEMGRNYAYLRLDD